MYAPIVLFVYNRPQHTKQTLEALANNDLAKESVLYIYADGPKLDASPDELLQIKQVRQVIRSAKWCKEIHIIESENNQGLAKSIIKGVTDVVNKYGNVIVLEDDILTAKGFLLYMNNALSLYKHDEKVMEVSGFMFPIETNKLPDTFFYNANSCWGWGTWKRAWMYFDNEPRVLYQSLINSGVNWNDFNAFQGDEFHKQLLQNISGEINTWAVKWHSVIYLRQGLVLHPRRSLTKNIGFDNSGVHSGFSDEFENVKLAEYIDVNRIELKPNHRVLRIIQKHFSQVYTKRRKASITRIGVIIGKIKTIFHETKSFKPFS